MSSKIIYGKFLVVDEQTVIPSGAMYIEDNRIVVWISEEDIELLHRYGASVTHHPGCNLRVRNGIAPVGELTRRGVIVAVGMDEKEVADDKDYLAELRIAASAITSTPCWSTGRCSWRRGSSPASIAKR